ncbi:DNA-binding protein RFXANK [Anthonomus grandis grandis]|uniref:DNA-binding protein RFXANK n=1 Tax=Anthonomus grandis grandis TaxID=2921223 RepID=UPI002166309A|nr:DNA-binding protein RFXANK [Anthonomus grandis grandis]
MDVEISLDSSNEAVSNSSDVTLPQHEIQSLVLSNGPKWSPESLTDKNRKSAFQPYKQCPTSTTVLTNLQRGNTQAETFTPQAEKLTFHMKAGQGELNGEDILKEPNVDILDSNGLTALHWGSAYGQLNAVEMLLKCGADVNKLGPDEETPLILAANGGHHEVIKLLLSNGANVNHEDHLCNTALMYAAKGNHPHTCLELLLQGANFGLVNLEDDTALTIATENNSTAAQVVIENYIISFMESHTKKEEKESVNYGL